MCTCIKMEGRHARKIHDYETLQGIRVKVEGGISTFLPLSLFLIRFECFHKFYICVCMCVCMCVCVCVCVCKKKQSGEKYQDFFSCKLDNTIK